MIHGALFRKHLDPVISVIPDPNPEKGASLRGICFWMSALRTVGQLPSARGGGVHSPPL